MKLRWYQSITLQLTVLFATASTVVLLLLGLLIWTSVEHHFETQDMELLAGKLKLAQHAVEKVSSRAELLTLPQRLDDSLIGHHGLSVIIVAPSGQILYASSGVAFPPELIEQSRLGEHGQPLVWRTANKQPFRGISALASTGVAGLPPAIVAVATDISLHEHFKKLFQITLWSFVLLAALLTGILGWVAARRGLAPLAAVKRKAADITAHQLHARLPVDAVPVELRDLVETLNDMLARLESSFHKLSDFSSDIAHELRTPVSNLLTQTQVMLARERTPDEYRDVLASNVEEFERLSGMIGDMLFLAKADDGRIIPTRADMSLAQLVDDLIEFYRLLADEKGVRITRSGDGQLVGDQPMMRRAIGNLLSNAIRHCDAQGEVAVAIESGAAGRQRVVVSNDGEAIPAEHLPRLFDRFYRADPSRHWDGSHSGLGLAIVKSIVQAHGGEVAVRSAAGRTSFVLDVPAGG